MTVTPPRLPVRVALVLLVLMAVAGALGVGHAAGQAGGDRWAGRWEMTFLTEGNGTERTTGALCCMEVVEITREQGLAYANGTTGDVINNTFTDVICSSGVEGRRYYEGTAPFEFVSGHTGVVPGPDRETMGVKAVFCTDDAHERIRGHYLNDLGAFDPLIKKPVGSGSLLAAASPSAPTFEGSVTRLPGDFPGPAYGTVWTGTCLSGPCRQVRQRPTMRVVRISAYNVFLSFLRGTKGARLELTRPDGTLRTLRLGDRLDLEDGDVVSSHGMYATIDITRYDGTAVTVTLEPGGSISAGSDPGLIRHRGGNIVAGSAAGFTADSAAFDAGTNQKALSPSSPVRTTVTGGGRVALSLDPGRQAVTVRNLAGSVQVSSGSAIATVAPGKEVLAAAGRVRSLPPPPNLARSVLDPRVISARPVSLVMPGRITTRALSRSSCLGTEARAVGSAQVLVTLLIGNARHGGVVSQRRLALGAGTSRVVCLPLPPKVRRISAGTPLTIALGVRAGAVSRLATGRIQLALV